MNATFRILAPRIMRDLIRDIPAWNAFDAAACVGNAGHESAGFTKLQEINPTVKGSRGGWGWFQWTGPRRRAFEKWANAKGFALNSYEANYGFLIHELRGPEAVAIPKTAAAVGLDAKVKAFELAFERAGIKHYPSRLRWATAALEAYDKSLAPTPAPKPKPKPPIPVIVAPDNPGAEVVGVPPPEPWWKKVPILRSVGQFLIGSAGVAGTITTLGESALEADWKVVAVLCAFATVAGIAAWALYWQATRQPVPTRGPS